MGETKKLQRKLTAITGAQPGLGWPPQSAYVFIMGRRQKELDEAVKAIGNNVTGVQGDIAKLTDLDRLFDAVATNGRIDVIFANAVSLNLLPSAKSPKSILKSSSTPTSMERCSRCRKPYRC